MSTIFNGYLDITHAPPYPGKFKSKPCDGNVLGRGLSSDRKGMVIVDQSGNSIKSWGSSDGYVQDITLGRTWKYTLSKASQYSQPRQGTTS